MGNSRPWRLQGQREVRRVRVKAVQFLGLLTINPEVKVGGGVAADTDSLVS